jgi:ATP-dependent DNA helicase RecG
MHSVIGITPRQAEQCVAIYDDRLEIWSSGELPLGMKVEDLKREHLSRPRNPLIAEVFYR